MNICGDVYAVLVAFYWEPVKGSAKSVVGTEDEGKNTEKNLLETDSISRFVNYHYCGLVFIWSGESKGCQPALH